MDTQFDILYVVLIMCKVIVLSVEIQLLTKINVY